MAVGAATLILLGVQLWIMRRQTEILDRQTALAAQQAEWRVVESVGTFVKLAFDLASEFRKANVEPGTQVMADTKAHPRHVLREAGRLFAPLGGPFVSAMNQAAMRLDEYFAAVDAYNRDVRGREGAQRYQILQVFREQVGRDLDLANRAIPPANRGRYDNGRDYDFHALCSLPAAYRQAVEGESSHVAGGGAN